MFCKIKHEGMTTMCSAKRHILSWFVKQHFFLSKSETGTFTLRGKYPNDYIPKYECVSMHRILCIILEI